MIGDETCERGESMEFEKRAEGIQYEDPRFRLVIRPDCVSSIDKPSSVSRAVHEEIELKYFYEGSSTLLIGSETVTVQAGDLVIMNPYELHSTIRFGAEKGRYPIAYTALATLTFVFAALSMSRNALVTASLAYASSLAYLSIFGERRRFFRRVALLELLTVALAFPIVYERVRRILSDYFERGFSDNGRFKLWRFALKSFSERMLFGNGFSGLVVSDELLYPFGPLVKQAHNTVIQLLCATGLFGTVSYIYYRVESLKPVFRNPSIKTVLAGASVAVLLVGSLADNFVFNIYPVFHYTVSMVIIHKSKAEKEGENN